MISVSTCDRPWRPASEIQGLERDRPRIPAQGILPGLPNGCLQYQHEPNLKGS